MKEIGEADLELVWGGTGYCRRLTFWERMRVQYVAAVFGEELALEVARSLSYS